jgi:hypothetical protein
MYLSGSPECLRKLSLEVARVLRCRRAGALNENPQQLTPLLEIIASALLPVGRNNTCPL